MAGWDFFVAFARGAWHAIWLVWPWLLGMAVMEWIIPGRKLHGPTWVFNAVYVPVYLTVAGMVLYPVAQLLAPRLPINLLGLNLEQLGWLGLSALLLFYLMLFDFFYYWFHRAQHTWGFMWRYHRFHHADCNVSVVSATRHHWLEELTRYFFMSAPLIILIGHPEKMLPWLGIVIGVGGMFIHWNTRLRLGWLTPVIVGPQYHRVHHSFAPQHIDKNFAVLFPFWDRVFGTQCLPIGDEFPPTGVPEVRRSNGWRLLLPWPSKNA
jgi:sterol desaturase/sphingolipid hydroxylase (fatty acid hydroxylase superfamily)